ncbi:hypothetical protein [Lentzea albidocapillata]|uniref:hypothetical protein n=1 Tax=Lentzea albidocapillata TaxID=40571 RepID=UPI0012FB9ACB|nr:hypothetical protein [Lentzea albidocapillata]
MIGEDHTFEWRSGTAYLFGAARWPHRVRAARRGTTGSKGSIRAHNLSDTIQGVRH